MTIYIDNELENRLKVFLKRVNDLNNTSLIKNYPKLKIKIFANNATDSSSFPSEDELALFFMKFRYFILEKDLCCFIKVINLLYQNESDQQWKEYISKGRKHFLIYQKKSPMNILLNDRTISPKEMADAYFNGEYFHSESKKNELFTQLRKVEPLASDFILLISLLEQTKAIFHIASYVEWRYFGRGKNDISE